MLNEGLNVDGMKLNPHPVNPGYLGTMWNTIMQYYQNVIIQV